MRFGTGPAQIERRDGRRVTTVSADVDPSIASADDVIRSLKEAVLPTLRSEFPDVRVSFGGEQREREEFLGAIFTGFLIALFVIYALLAIPFRSYAQPFVIMFAIPFGFIGGVLGHLLFQMDLTMFSLLGLVGVGGVVVNDSLVMIDFANEERAKGRSMAEAIVEAGRVRFRPILLTSITTFLGVFPLILETSVQAQFLIPLGVALGFGILFATAVIMVLVPALTMAQHRAAQFVHAEILGRDGPKTYGTHE